MKSLIEIGWEAFLRWRDERAIYRALIDGDYHRYALERMHYWRRWER